MKPADRQTRKRRRILAVALAGAVFILCGGCEEQASIEPARPAAIAGPTTGPVAPGEEAIGRLPPEIAEVYRALAWSESEKNILASVNDYDRQWRETAFFTVMRRVRTVRQLATDAFNALDRPSYNSLLSDPGRYRARPVRLSVHAYTVARLQPGKHFTASARWTLSDGPIWRMDCGNAMTRHPADEPLSVFCAFDPINLLGKPYKVDENGRAIYRGGQRADIAGVFFKVYRDMERGDSEHAPRMRNYPIVLAWQISRPRGGIGPASADPTSVAIIIIVVMLAAVYVILRRTTKRSAAHRALRRGSYRPLRSREMEAEPAGKDQPGDRDDRPSDIDPILKAASEQYRKEKGLDDG